MLGRQHTGETEALYPRKVVKVAMAIVDRIGATGNPQLREAVFGIVRIAAMNADRKVTLNAVGDKLNAFGIQQDEIDRFLNLVMAGTMIDLIEYVHPTLKDSKYTCRIHGL